MLGGGDGEKKNFDEKKLFGPTNQLRKWQTCFFKSRLMTDWGKFVEEIKLVICEWCNI